MKAERIEIKRISNNRRYYLHYKLRRLGYRVDSRERTVFVPYGEFEKRTYRKPIIGKYIEELNSAGYGIQSSII